MSISRVPRAPCLRFVLEETFGRSAFFNSSLSLSFSIALVVVGLPGDHPLTELTGGVEADEEAMRSMSRSRCWDKANGEEGGGEREEEAEEEKPQATEDAEASFKSISLTSMHACMHACMHIITS